MKILYKGPTNGFLGRPKKWPRDGCDMLIGPCACGGWHTDGEFSNPDFEIRDWPPDASRELWVEHFGETYVLEQEAKVLQQEAKDNFTEYLKLFTVPRAEQVRSSRSVIDFLESIPEQIRDAACTGRCFTRLGIPSGFERAEEVCKWLAARGYQATHNDLEITVIW